MSKVLGIVGSPRKNGNTHALVSRMLEGAAAEGAQTELLFLNELTINECDGCHVCWMGKPCSKRDDMNALYERINKADALVLGTPVYWYAPTALMKGFMDRFVYYNCEHNRQYVQNKPVLLTVPYEETDEATVAPVVQFFEKSLSYLGMSLKDRLTVGGLEKKGAVTACADVMEQAYLQGKQLVKAYKNE